MNPRRRPMTREEEEREERLRRFHALGIPKSDFNAMVDAMRAASPGTADGVCRQALFALAVAGYWPTPIDTAGPVGRSDKGRE